MPIRGSQLTIIMPVYNEAGSLPQVLPEVIDGCRKNNFHLIVVNDGSKDDSARILEQFAHRNPKVIQVVHHKLNKGYGGALKTGIMASDTPYVLTMDADGQHDFSDVTCILQHAFDNDADMVIGTREGKISGWFRNLGKSLIRTLTRMLVPLGEIDLNSGFKLFRTELAQKYCTLGPDGMAFSDVITITFLSERKLVLSLPITIRERIAGKSTIKVSTAINTVIEILNIVMLFNPLKIFLPLSFVLVLIGLLWGIPFLLMGRGVSVGAMLAVVLGALFFVLGLLAQQLSEIRLSQIR